MKRIIGAIILLSILLAGCNKITASSLKGTYSGTRYSYSNYPAGQPPVESLDAITLKVEKHRKDVEILNFEIPQDSLADGEYVWINNTGNSNKIEIKQDSILLLVVNMYAGGFVDYDQYRLKKQK